MAITEKGPRIRLTTKMKVRTIHKWLITMEDSTVFKNGHRKCHIRLRNITHGKLAV